MFAAFDLLVADFAHFYGVDLETGGRTWEWFRRRVDGLITLPRVMVIGPEGVAVESHQSRLGNALQPPIVHGGKDG